MVTGDASRAKRRSFCTFLEVSSFFPLSDDFEAGIVNVTFAPGSNSSTCTVAVLGDDLIEETEAFTIALQSPSLGSVDQSAGSATVFITDDESKNSCDWWIASYVLELLHETLISTA